jgi:hypothetical protein
MTKPINTDSIEKATNKTWQDWVSELESSNAKTMSHTDLVDFVTGRVKGLVENEGWWGQSIAVAFEQHTGQRAPGQLSNGLFEVAVSKTASIPRDELFPEIVKWFERQEKLNKNIFSDSRISETPNRSNWRCNFSDKSKFSATVENNGEKSKLVLSHTAIPTKADATSWKQYWQQIVDDLVES